MRFTCIGRIFCALVALLGAVAAAEAHPVAQGSMEVRIAGSEVRMIVRVSMEEVFVQSALSAGENEVHVAPAELCRPSRRLSPATCASSCRWRAYAGPGHGGDAAGCSGAAARDL